MSTPAAGNGDQQKTQTELKVDAGRKANARHGLPAGPVAPQKPNGGGGNVSQFSSGETIEARIVEARAAKQASEREKQDEQLPDPHDGGDTRPLNFDQATALEFYNAVQPNVCMLGFTQGRRITSAEEFQALAREADDKHEHLFFHVATLKPDWNDPTRHAKGKVTTATKEHVLECPYLWSDCDAEKYVGNDPVKAAKHYESEGSRVKAAIDEGLLALGITPSAIWRSGAGWQFLVKLDQAIEPDEAETLVGKLHTALGFDPTVRNCNRILRVPGSINWKDGKNGRVPAPCTPLHLRDTVARIDEVRKALANITEPVKEAKPSGATEIKIDWSKVKPNDGWLKSVADLPDDAPAKLKMIIGHTGSLKDLNQDLIARGMLAKGHRSWSEVTLAIAASLKLYGKHTPEQIAEALLAKLPCNQHIAKQDDKGRAIERAIARSHEPKPVPNVNGHWPGGQNNDTGRPKKNILNTIEAIARAGITCTHDEFRQKEYWRGHEDKKFDGEVSDAAVTVTRVNTYKAFRFYPKVEETREAITYACHANKSNPVLDYFAGLEWDGTPRLDKLLHRYLGADTTPLNEAISCKVVCAIVRRAKHPGCKFDHQLVLQSPQGRKKSMFCEDLAVFSDLYTDAGDLSGTIKEQMEIVQGMQIIEFSELAGYGRATRERNKASLSRKNDRARLSYAHYATNQPRQSIPIATTNEDHYLNDPSGERRYWHVAVTLYERDAFLADKDQIYAEAVAREPTENLWLDTPKLEAAHDAVVATIKAPNELVDILADLRGEVWHVSGKDEERVSTADIRFALGLTATDAVRSHNIGQRIEDAMKTLGYTKAPGTIRCHKGQAATTGYTRPMPLGPLNAPRPSHGPLPSVCDVGEAEDADVEIEDRNLAILHGRAAQAQTDFAQATIDIEQTQANLVRMKGNA